DLSTAVKYQVEFRRAAVNLLQADRPHFRVRGASAKLDGDAAGFKLAGTVADPRWGTWGVDCSQVSATGAIGVHLKTAAPVKVDQKMLEALPFVPKTVWANVKADGTTPADVRVRLWTNKPDVSYRVELEPADTKLHVTAIDLKTEGVGGKVTVEDAVVKLDGVSGSAAKGKVQTSGTLDFRAAVTSLAFAIKADKLWLRQLPERWELPDKITGKISGEANIVVKVGETVTTTGTGKGRVTEAAFGLVPIFTPIELELYADKGRLRFRSGKPAVMHGMMGLMTVGLAAPPVEPVPPASPAGIASRVGDGVLWLTRAIAGGAKRAADGLARLEKMSRPGEETTYLDAKFSIEDVDLVTLAEQFSLPLPDGVRGTASIDLTTSIPINNARDPRAYRLAGSLSSPRLVLGSYTLDGLKATLRYADGLARLSGLSARVGGGAVTGTATAQLAPTGDINLDITAAKLSLFDLLPRELRRQIDGDVSGRVRVTGALNRADDIRSWRGSAAVRSGRLDAFGVPLRDSAADLTLAAGTLLVSDLRGDLLGTRLSADGGVNLVGGYRYDVTARLRGVEVARLPLLLPGSWTTLDLGGALDVSGKFAGSLTAGAEGSGRVRATSLRLSGLAAGPLQARWKLAGTRLTLEEVQGTALGGMLTGKGDVSPAGGAFDLQLAGVQAATLAKAAPGLTVPARGTLDAKAKVTLGFEPFRADADVDLGGSRVAVAGVPVQRLTGRLRGRDGRLDYEAQGDLLGGRVRVEGRYPPPPMGSVGQPHGRLRIDRLYVGKALAAFSPDTGRGPWRGYVALDLPFRHDGPGGSLTGTGRFEVRDLRYNDVELADSLRGDLRLTRQGLFLRDINTTFAGGLLRLQATYRFDDPVRSWFNLNLAGAETGRVAAALGQRGGGYRGRLEVRLRGTMGPEWRGTGEVRLTRGRAAGVDVGEWGVPLDFTYVPARGTGEVVFRDSSAPVGSGRARARG
ncbi:MAG: hypothetical protein ACRC33_01800, partial [Gemmataceae bacterium]